MSELQTELVSESEDYSSDKSRQNTLKGIGIASIVLILIGIAVFLVVPFVGWLVGIAMFSIGGLLSFVGNIIILATNWTKSSLRDSKILWGLIGIFLIGPISVIVFGCLI